MKRFFVYFALTSCFLCSACSDGDGDGGSNYETPDYTVPAYTEGSACQETFSAFCDGNKLVSCDEGKVKVLDCNDYSDMQNTCVWTIAPNKQSDAACDIPNDTKCTPGSEGEGCEYSRMTVNGQTTEAAHLLKDVCVKASNGGTSSVTIEQTKCDELTCGGKCEIKK